MRWGSRSRCTAINFWARSMATHKNGVRRISSWRRATCMECLNFMSACIGCGAACIGHILLCCLFKLDKIGKAFMRIREWNNAIQYWIWPTAPNPSFSKRALSFGIERAIRLFQGLPALVASAMQWMLMCNKIEFWFDCWRRFFHYLFSLLSLCCLCSHVSGSHTFSYIYCVHFNHKINRK